MSTSYELVGTLAVIGDTQQVKETFQKRAFVVSVMDGNYEQLIECQVTKDKCRELDGYKVGDQVRVLFNLRGRKWHNPTKGIDQYFTTLEAWKLERNGFGNAPTQDKTEMFDDVPF